MQSVEPSWKFFLSNASSVFPKIVLIVDSLIFSSFSKSSHNEWAKNVEVLENGGIWLRYLVKN